VVVLVQAVLEVAVIHVLLVVEEVFMVVEVEDLEMFL
jgi:hypothetical protein